MIQSIAKENNKFIEQYTTDTVRNTEKVLDMINFKVEENQGMFDEKFETALSLKEIIDEKKKIDALVDTVSTLVKSVEKLIGSEKQARETQL